MQEDGNLKAGYFIQKSVNAAKAMQDNRDGLLEIYITLRDENYPGSHYKLFYSQENDAMAADYFLAAEALLIM